MLITQLLWLRSSQSPWGSSVYGKELAKVASSSVPACIGWMYQRDLKSREPLWFADVFEVIK